MSSVWDLNLINFLTFYVTLMFFVSSWRRFSQYSELVALAISGPRRWPRLLKLVREHRMVFLTWTTFGPALMALGLTVVQWLMSHVFLPEAGLPETGLTLGKLWEHPLELPIALGLFACVLAIDLYFSISVGVIDRPMLEKYFDQAEYWLGSPAAKVVHFVTLGQINPRLMVSEEVQKALVDASALVNRNLWWVILQLGLRFAFGLALWIIWWTQ